MFKWKHLQKTRTSNQRHLSVLVFEIDLILPQKQERATKSSKKQEMENGNTPQKPKRATTSNKKQQRAFFHSHFHLFTLTFDLWKVVDIKSNENPERASVGKEKKRKAAEGDEEQQKAKTNIGAGQTKMSNKKPKRATNVTESLRLGISVYCSNDDL